jgi:hypothetical protein
MTTLDITIQLVGLIDEIGSLQSKLILLVGAPHAGKTELLRSLGSIKGVVPLNLGALLGARLAGIPQRQRHLQTASIMRELADKHAFADVLLIDNIEILFDRALQLDPLELLKRHAHSRRVVAVWPGQLQGDVRTGRLTYADMGHPEYQDYSLAGLTPFHLQ